MNNYYVDYPRDFSNEYTVYAVRGVFANSLKRVCRNAVRITRCEAIRLGITRPSQARKHGEQWYGGFVEDVAFHRLQQSTRHTIKDRLEAVIADTTRYIESVNQDHERLYAMAANGLQLNRFYSAHPS